MRHYDGKPDDIGVYWAMRAHPDGSIESSWESVFDFFHPEYELRGNPRGEHVLRRRDAWHEHRSEQRLLRRRGEEV